MDKKVSFPFDPVEDGWFIRTVEFETIIGVKAVRYSCTECDFSMIVTLASDLADDDRIMLEDHARFHELLFRRFQKNTPPEPTLITSDKLTAIDYLTEPFQKLVRHPDYNPTAMDVAMRIAILSTEDLEGLDTIIGGK